MKIEIEITETEIKNLKRIRNYFGVHNKTALGHMAYIELAKLIKNLNTHKEQLPCPECSDYGRLDNKDGTVRTCPCHY